MEEKIILKLKCPMCKRKQDYIVAEGFQKLLCDPGDGGCDEYFAIDLWFDPNWITYELNRNDE